MPHRFFNGVLSGPYATYSYLFSAHTRRFLVCEVSLNVTFWQHSNLFWNAHTHTLNHPSTHALNLGKCWKFVKLLKITSFRSQIFESVICFLCQDFSRLAPLIFAASGGWGHVIPFYPTRTDGMCLEVIRLEFISFHERFLCFVLDPFISNCCADKFFRSTILLWLERVWLEQPQQSISGIQ